jgi:hypothetical protein
LALLQDLHAAWPAAGPRPLFLADRGFPKDDLLQWLQQHQWGFLIRGKQSAVVRDAQGRRVYLNTMPLHATRFFPNARLGEKEVGPLHVVVRTFPGKQRAVERWILFTNLPEERLAWATCLYAHRMHPEQTHRDCKHGHFLSGFALRHLERLRADRMERLLFCLGVCYAFLNLLAETRRETRAWLQERHWGLSLVTFALDLLTTLTPKELRETIRTALQELKWLPLWWPDDAAPAGGEQTTGSLCIPAPS